MVDTVRACSLKGQRVCASAGALRRPRTTKTSPLNKGRLLSLLVGVRTQFARRRPPPRAVEHTMMQYSTGSCDFI